VSRKQKKRTLSSLILRVLPRNVVKLDSIPELCQGFFLLGVFLALDGEKIRISFSCFTYLEQGIVCSGGDVYMGGLVGHPPSILLQRY